jgi:hypothetical protein
MRNHLKKLVIFTGLLSTLLVGVSGQAIADDNHAFTTFRAGVGARALAMGSAYTAVADDATAGYWNPAGLTGIEKFNLSSMISANMSEDRKNNYVAIGYNFGTAGWGAFSWLNGGVGDIPYSPDQVTAPGSTTFNSDEHGFLFSYGNKMNKLDVGATFKVAYIKVGSYYSKSGVGFDAGLKYILSDHVHLGVVARDLGTKVGRDAVPVDFRVGLAAMAFDGFTFAADVEKIQHQDNVKLHLGSEYDYEFAKNYFGAIRAGVSDGSFSIGAGLTVMGKYSIDYAYVTESQDFLGENHRVSLTLSF